MILCHQRHDFQLRMHNKAFGGRALPGPDEEAHNAPQTITGFREGAPGGEGKEKTIICFRWSEAGTVSRTTSHLLHHCLCSGKKLKTHLFQQSYPDIIM